MSYLFQQTILSIFISSYFKIQLGTFQTFADEQRKEYFQDPRGTQSNLYSVEEDMLINSMRNDLVKYKYLPSMSDNPIRQIALMRSVQFTPMDNLEYISKKV